MTTPTLKGAEEAWMKLVEKLNKRPIKKPEKEAADDK